MKFLDRLLGKDHQTQEDGENAQLIALILSTLRLQLLLVEEAFHPTDSRLPSTGPTGLGRATGYILGFATRVYINAKFFDPARTDRLQLLLMCVFQNIYGNDSGLDMLEVTASATPQSNPELRAGYERGKVDAELWMSNQSFNAPGGLAAICNGFGEDAAPLP